MIYLDFNLVVLTSIFMIITSLTIFIVIYFFKRIVNNILIEIRNREVENRSLITNLRKELSGVTIKVSGLISDLDSLTARVYKLESTLYAGGEVKEIRDTLPIKSESKFIEKKPVRKKTGETLTKTELRILQLLSSGPKSSREIRDTLKLSREHIARKLKTLYEKGYVVRYTDSKPYVYEISESGLSLIRT